MDFLNIARGFNHGDTDCDHDCALMIVTPWLKPRAMFDKKMYIYVRKTFVKVSDFDKGLRILLEFGFEASG
ncbi:hypothetical protein B0A65_14780 [Flavobacterium frigidimaris]|uniref:Uncharacterized protein n=1 Tax=Flavobacterium frigidimaris TaxID=262320 RepID=A0ABX4BNY3_FLAFR|nr:hypothetical protein B0A65_14780 [Flavobacterium frigidimaris]